MQKLKEVEKAVRLFSKNDLKAFREWFAEFDSERWDEQLQSDIRAGKLDELAKQAKTDFLSGNFKPL